MDEQFKIELSLYSRVFKRELQMNKFQCNRLSIDIHTLYLSIDVRLESTEMSFDFNFSDSDLPILERLRINECLHPFIRDCCRPKYHATINTKKERRTELFEKVLRVLVDVLDFRKADIVEADVVLDPDLMDSSFWSMPIEYKNFKVKNLGSQINFIVQHVQTECLRFVYNTDFSHIPHGSISYRNVKFNEPINLSFNHFNQSIIQRIDIKPPCASLISELNQFFKMWIDGAFPNLLVLTINNEGRYNGNWLPTKEIILDGIDYVEVLELSLHCKAFKRELQLNKLTCKKFNVQIPAENFAKITINLSQHVLNFIFSSIDDLKWHQKTKLKKLIAPFLIEGDDFRVKIDSKKESSTEFFDVIFQHLTNVISFQKAQEVALSVEVCSELLSSKSWNLSIKYSLIQITCPGEHLNFVAQHLKTDKLILKSDFSDASSGVLSFREIELVGPLNLLFVHFDQSLVQTIKVDEPCVSLVRDLNNFLKLWTEGGFPELGKLVVRALIPQAGVILEGIEWEPV